MTTHEVEGWEQADEVCNRHAGGKFLRLEPGESTRVAFCARPLGIEQHWIGGSSVRCTGAGCTSCAKGSPTKGRVRINAFVLKEGAPKIFENGTPWYRELKILKKKYDGTDGRPVFAEMSFEITRHGTGKKTKYMTLPDKALTAEEKAKIAAAQLHNLEAQDEDEEVDDDDNGGGATINAHVRDEFIGRLRALKSDTAVNSFLGELGCERISDIPAADEQRARRYLESLERKKPEINPFS